MCTVVIHVPDDETEPTRLLAVRDEDPARPWNPLGRWWPEADAGVVGVRDVRAGGAWLAADPAAGRLAVLLNRADVTGRPESEIRSRGGIVLDAVAGRSPADDPATHGFNLVSVDGPRTVVTTWDGTQVRRIGLAPGTHMIAHGDPDDPSTPRIARWLPAFRDTPPAPGSHWYGPWIDLLAASAALESTDDAAIIRDNRPYGYPTLSLLACVAAVTADDVDVHYGELSEPGHWGGLDL